MKKQLVSALRIGIPLGLGVFLIYYVYDQLTPSDLDQIYDAFARANYLWVIVALVLAVFSHMSRAYRWKYTLRPVGYEPRFANSFFSVMLGYLVNLAVPRLGELSRCTAMSRYEKMDFNKLLGTVIAERVADLIILVMLITVTLYFQFDQVAHLIEGTSVEKVMNNPWLLLALGAGGLAGVWLFLRILKVSDHPFVVKIRGFVEGVLEGVKSIWTMRNRGWFIFHTLLIWALYFAMFAVGFWVLPELKDVPIAGILAGFVLGGISIAATNGGIGAYPLAMQQILILYGVDSNIGLAFGWISWTAQTIMILLVGGLSVVALPWYNREKPSQAIS